MMEHESTFDSYPEPVSPDILERLYDPNIRLWRDAFEKRLVTMGTAILAEGCRDWGMPDGKRRVYKNCTFCPLPELVRDFENHFYGGKIMPPDERKRYFDSVLREIGNDLHTLFVVNAGSFHYRGKTIPEVHDHVVWQVAMHPNIKHLVVEDRAMLLSGEKPKLSVPALEDLNRHADMLHSESKVMTVRLGVEAGDEELRNKKLGKGATNDQIEKAARNIRDAGARSGAYLMIKPTQMSSEQAIDDVRNAIDLMQRFGVDEVYLSASCVAGHADNGNPVSLHNMWQNGRYTPPSLQTVHHAVMYAASVYGDRAHFLPMSDPPEPYIAIPSAVDPRGVHEDRKNDSPIDRAYHAMFQHYRMIMDPAILDRGPTYLEN